MKYLILLCIVLFTSNTFSQSKEDKIKAVFIYQFAKKTTWPAQNDIDTLKIGIYNNQFLSDQLNSIFTSNYYSSENVTDLNKLLNYKIIYVHINSEVSIKKLKEIIGTKSVLLVTDEFNNSDEGLMINFYKENARIIYSTFKQNIENKNIILDNGIYSLSKSPLDENTLKQLLNETKEELYSEKNKNNKLELENKKLISDIDALEKQKKVLIENIKTNENELAEIYKRISVQKDVYKELTTNLLLKENEAKLSNEKLAHQSLLLTEKEEAIKKSEKEIALQINQINTSKKKLQEIEAKMNNALILLENQTIIIYGISLIALIIGIIGYIAFNNYLAQKKQAKIILRQKEEVENQRNEIQVQHQELEEKNKEITDSITYAKRIQNAILPMESFVTNSLPNSFIFYKPKDIVAGDFYWLEQTETATLFAVADCTGHGVPGALVSVVCHNALNRAVREFKLQHPFQILDKTRELVIEQFEKTTDDVKDGMDIALCALNGYELEFSGANNPLWLIRKGSNEVTEIKANKQPVGKFSAAVPFLSTKIELFTGDTFYVFSDGFSDQFGGENGKKFKSNNLKKLLVAIQNEPMIAQKSLLAKTFEDWRGNTDQIDDICIWGVRV